MSEADRLHWKWLGAALLIVSALDFYDHVRRDGAPFAAAWPQWLGFTMASTLSLLAIAYAAALVLRRLKLPTIAADTVAFGLAVASHLIVTGPLWDRVFWTGQLRFDAVMLPTLMGMAFYLLYRLLFHGAQFALSQLRRVAG